MGNSVLSNIVKLSEAYRERLYSLAGVERIPHSWPEAARTRDSRNSEIIITLRLTSKPGIYLDCHTWDLRESGFKLAISPLMWTGNANLHPDSHKPRVTNPKPVDCTAH